MTVHSDVTADIETHWCKLCFLPRYVFVCVCVVFVVLLRTSTPEPGVLMHASKKQASTQVCKHTCVQGGRNAGREVGG